jgi:hypothetical protein
MAKEKVAQTLGEGAASKKINTIKPVRGAGLDPGASAIALLNKLRGMANEPDTSARPIRVEVGEAIPEPGDPAYRPEIEFGEAIIEREGPPDRLPLHLRQGVIYGVPHEGLQSQPGDPGIQRGKWTIPGDALIRSPAAGLMAVENESIPGENLDPYPEVSGMRPAMTPLGNPTVEAEEGAIRFLRRLTPQGAAITTIRPWDEE